jgi:hypothetical protein
MRLYRPLTVVVGIVLVILGGLVRLAEPDQVMDDVTRYATRGTVGEPLVDQDFTLTVTWVKLAESVDPKPDDDDDTANEADRPIATDGIFVTVEYQIEGRHKKGSAGGATLKTDEGTEYKPINKIIRTQMNIPPPGFVESSSLVFEANPDDLAGLTLWMKELRAIDSLTEDYAVDLAIPDQRVADEMVDSAERSYPLSEPTMRAAQ